MILLSCCQNSGQMKSPLFWHTTVWPPGVSVQIDIQAAQLLEQNLFLEGGPFFRPAGRLLPEKPADIPQLVNGLNEKIIRIGHGKMVPVRMISRGTVLNNGVTTIAPVGTLSVDGA